MPDSTVGVATHVNAQLPGVSTSVGTFANAPCHVESSGPIHPGQHLGQQLLARMNRSGGFNVAGSIRKRPDRGADTWQLRVYVGRDSNGRIRHRSHTFQGSKRAAEKELARLVLEQDAAPQVVPDEAGPGGRPPLSMMRSADGRPTAGTTSAQSPRADTRASGNSTLKTASARGESPP